MSSGVTGEEKKRLRTHHFTLCLPQKTKHNYGDPRYEESKWYSINFQWVFGMQLIGGGGGESTKLLGMMNLPWQGIKKTFTKIEAYAGMAERLARDLAIGETLQNEIK